MIRLGGWPRIRGQLDQGLVFRMVQPNVARAGQHAGAFAGAGHRGCSFLIHLQVGGEAGSRGHGKTPLGGFLRDTMRIWHTSFFYTPGLCFGQERKKGGEMRRFASIPQHPHPHLKSPNNPHTANPRPNFQQPTPHHPHQIPDTHNRP